MEASRVFLGLFWRWNCIPKFKPICVKGRQSGSSLSSRRCCGFSCWVFTLMWKGDATGVAMHTALGHWVDKRVSSLLVICPHSWRRRALHCHGGDSNARGVRLYNPQTVRSRLQSIKMRNPMRMSSLNKCDLEGFLKDGASSAGKEWGWGPEGSRLSWAFLGVKAAYAALAVRVTLWLTDLCFTRYRAELISHKHQSTKDNDLFLVV